VIVFSMTSCVKRAKGSSRPFYLAAGLSAPAGGLDHAPNSGKPAKGGGSSSCKICAIAQSCPSFLQGDASAEKTERPLTTGTGPGDPLRQSTPSSAVRMV